MKTKLLALLLAALILLSSVACNSGSGETEAPSSVPPTEDTGGERPEDKPATDNPSNENQSDESPSDESPSDKEEETDPRHETSDLDFFEESVTLAPNETFSWETHYRDPYNTTDEVISGNEEGILEILGTVWSMWDQYSNQYKYTLTIQAMDVGTTTLKIEAFGQVRVLHVTVTDMSGETQETPVETPTETADTHRETEEVTEEVTEEESFYAPSRADNATISDLEVFNWYVKIPENENPEITFDNEGIISVIAKEIISNDESGIGMRISLTANAQGVDTCVQVSLKISESDTRTLSVTVPKKSLIQLSEPPAEMTCIEEVVHLNKYELFEWTPYFPGVQKDDITVTETNSGLTKILDLSTYMSSTGSRLHLYLYSLDTQGYNKITVQHGEYTRILHVFTNRKNFRSPDPNGMINLFFTEMDGTLIAGEGEAYLRLDASFSSAGNLKVETSDEEIFTVRYELISDVDEASGAFIDYISLYVTPVSAGIGTVTLSYPEHPNVTLTIPIKVIDEGNVLLGNGTLCEGISVDKTDAEVYKDDTTVTYNILTSTDVDKIELIHLSNDYFLPVKTFTTLLTVPEESIAILDKLVIDESSLTGQTVYVPETRTSYTANRTEQDGKYLWCITWDLGNTAVRFVRVNAIDTDTETVDTSYLKLNITYPVFDVSEGLLPVINRWVELNLTEPLFFTVDTEKLTDYQKYVWFEKKMSYLLFMDEVEMLMGNPTPRSSLGSHELSRLQNLDDKEFYDLIFDNNVIYRRTFASGLMPYAMVGRMSVNHSGGDGYPQFFGKQYMVYGREEDVFFFHYEIYDETRALIAYENGYEIDKEKFPYAYDILEKGKAIISEIITPDMTDFEKEKAVYDWMIQNYYKGVKVPPEIGDPLYPNPEWLACVKGAYGILNQYEADCMGWSAAFYLLCNMAGLPCSTFSCNNEPGGATNDFMANHRINVVRLGGEYYFVDSYWFFQKTEEGQGDYRYLNMTAETAAKHYSWIGSEGFVPTSFANGTTYLVDEHTGALLKP